MSTVRPRKDMVSAITEAVISTVNGVGRILYLRPFNEHVGSSVTDGPNIQDIVRGSRAFRTTSAEISGKVEADFAEAEVQQYGDAPHPLERFPGNLFVCMCMCMCVLLRCIDCPNRLTEETISVYTPREPRFQYYWCCDALNVFQRSVRHIAPSIPSL